MAASPQRKRPSDRPLQHNQIAAGCVSLLVIALSLGLCSRCIETSEEPVPPAEIETVDPLPASS